MIPIAIAVAIYAVVLAIAFASLPPRAAIALGYTGGWLLLPVGAFPGSIYGVTVEVTTAALPADTLLVTKAWLAPVATLLLASLAGYDRIRRWRPAAVDLPVLAWCLWPFATAAWNGTSAPPPIVSTAYLIGTWGAPWLLARVFLADADGRRGIVETLATAGMLALPLAFVETIAPPSLYHLLYGAHPFASDAIWRPVGYRPLLLFENSAQYGMAIGMAALAAVAAWRWSRTRFAVWRAGMLLTAAMASQSFGGIGLGAIGIALILAGPRLHRLRYWLAAVAVGWVAATVFLFAEPVREAEVGQYVDAVLRKTERGSMPWRISENQRIIPLARDHMVTGEGMWDWWKPSDTRPWGLAILVTGQFGLVALLLLAIMLVQPFVRLVRRAAAPEPAALVLAVIALLAAIDASLNAFVFLPAIVAAGAAATTRRATAVTGTRTETGAALPARG